MKSRRESVRSCAAALLKAALGLVRFAAECYQVTLIGTDEEVEAAFGEMQRVQREVLK